MKVAHGQITIDNVSWTPIKALIDCYRMIINNITTVDLKLRTDSTDPLTEYTLQSLLEDVVDAPINTVIGKNETILFGQLSAGTAAIQIRCRHSHA